MFQVVEWVRALLVFLALFFVLQTSFEAKAQPYTWQINSITVLDEKGAAYQQPFLGGFNIPRPQLVDIDADGDQDLFIQEKSNQLIFFEHDAAQSGFPYVLQSTRFQNLAIGEWYRFADLDGDGDQDLLAEQLFSLVRYYRNDGSAETPLFTLVADTLLDDQNEPLFADRQNIPNVTDIDCDGQADLFVGRLDGTIRRYELDSFDANGAPRFTLVDDRFQDIEIVAEGVGKLVGREKHDERHGANTLTFVDLDEDGDQDIIWGDFFEAGLLYLENAGTCEIPDFSMAPIAFPPNAPLQTSGYNAPAFGDINRDGVLDLLVGVLGGAFSSVSNTADNLYFYTGVSGLAMEARSTRYLSNLDVGSDAYPVLRDLDGDLDLDLIVSNSINPQNSETAAAYLFENTGSPTHPVFQETGELLLEPAFNYAPAFGDLDADGIDDMLVGSWQGPIAWYKKGDASPGDFSLVNGALLDVSGGSNTTPALVDLDGDGDLDVVAGEANGTLNYFENTGSSTNPVFGAAIEGWMGIDAGRRSVPVFMDLDVDGDQDLVLGSDQDGLQVYQNTGNEVTPVFQLDPALLDLTLINTAGLDLVDVRRLAPAVADLDADSDLDLIIGTLEGGLLYLENTAVASSSERLGYDAGLHVEIFPQPFSAKATLQVNTDAHKKAVIYVFDVLGRRVLEKQVGNIQPGMNSLDIEMEGKSAGVYVISIRFENGDHYSRPIIYQP